MEFRVKFITPDEYRGELLCQRCGRDSDGNYHIGCEDARFTHEEACVPMRFAHDLCDKCKDTP